MKHDKSLRLRLRRAIRGRPGLLGGKGIGLAEMTQLGVPVPAGFTITTDACRATWPPAAISRGLGKEVDEHLAKLEEKTGKRFGDPQDPLSSPFAPEPLSRCPG